MMPKKKQAVERSTGEHRRLADTQAREGDWYRWGPYLSERQWGTVREDYSPAGNAWEYFSHDYSGPRNSDQAIR